MKYLIADFKWDIAERFDCLSAKSKDYLANFESADFAISASDKDLEYEQSVSEFPFEKPYLEYITVLRKIGEILPFNNAFILHGACFDVEGTGVALLAKSGTGKTTHLARWKKFLKDKMTIVNGDKPIIRFKDDEIIAYGTPWCGKENLGQNTKTQLKHICFIERSQTNYIEKITKDDALPRIFNQVYMPISDPKAVTKTMELIDRLLSLCEIWKIHCNMDDDAGEIAYNNIFKK